MRFGLAVSVAAIAAAATSVAASGAMHPALGARLSGMGEHGVVNISVAPAHHRLCWRFSIPTKGATAASIRDAHGMVVAKLGRRYSKKGCAMVSVKALRLLDTKPAKYSVWVDTKAHPGDLRGKLSAGMAHM
ncbi:hypothetical protein [Gaiella sp.]|jgi:hypothetical protein|uniref:hypothetical protein n=1 Tax=Gaiella sp. TaxID=2663207 RepID=UPI002E3103D4|nr:hypothetical protein [Gaiella sp.]HEX5582669.1 hypothetical protein [Gaiella sp.]